MQIKELSERTGLPTQTVRFYEAIGVLPPYGEIDSGKIGTGELDIQGMTCDSCVLHVERALKKVPCVREAKVPGWKSRRTSVVLEENVDSQALAERFDRPGIALQ